MIVPPDTFFSSRILPVIFESLTRASGWSLDQQKKQSSRGVNTEFHVDKREIAIDGEPTDDRVSLRAEKLRE